MNAFAEWAEHWRVSDDAIADLRRRLCESLPLVAALAAPARSEAAVQAAVRLAATKRGWRLWRNNVGAYADPLSGSFVRYGLANDSHALNAVVKSGDLIGVAPRIIAPSDVGQLIGQFVSLEVKREGWRYTGTGRESAQAAWIALIESMGGQARFISSEQSL
jgi:hypothetical protein